MPPKQATQRRGIESAPGNTSSKGKPGEAEIKQESSKAAKQAQALNQKAQDLTRAAMGAADPDERQKLLNEALNASIEAESFGKTAKYLNTGTFQGLIAGSAPGVIAGGSLGTLTGSLVGGVTTLIVGGLGGALGSAFGAIHGQFFKLGDLAGAGIRKITGDLPGIKASDEQKETLEKMIKGTHETPRPSDDELSKLAGGGGAGHGSGCSSGGGESKTWTENAKDYVPSIRSWSGGGSDESEEEPQVASDEVDASKPGDSKSRVKPPRNTSAKKPAIRKPASSTAGKPAAPDSIIASPGKPGSSAASVSDSKSSDLATRSKAAESDKPAPRPASRIGEKRPPPKMNGGTKADGEIKAPGGGAGRIGEKKKPRKLNA